MRALANGNSGAADFVRPGHVFPLIAKEGGVLMRSGHTEACVDLCRLAGLPPVGVLSELMNDDGTVMRGAGGRGLRRAAQAQAHLDRRPDRLPAGARKAGRARRRVPGHDRDRRAQRLRLRDAVRPGLSHGAGVRPHRRRPRRADPAASRQHPDRDLFGGADRRCTARCSISRKEGRGVIVFLRDGSAGVPVSAPPRTQRRTASREARASASGARSAWARRSCTTSASRRSAC